MATSFPGGLDNFTNPSPGDEVESALIGNHNDAIEALEAKVGVVGSPGGMPIWFAPTNSLSVNVAASFAWKGNIYTPSYNQRLLGLRYLGAAPAAGSTVGAAVITVSAGAIATITSSPDVVTAPSTPGTQNMQAEFFFTTPVVLTSGTAYGLCAGFTTTGGGNGATTSLPVYFALRAYWATMWSRAGTFSSSAYHIASLTPAVATAVTTATNAQASGDGAYWVAPLIERIV